MFPPRTPTVLVLWLALCNLDTRLQPLSKYGVNKDSPGTGFVLWKQSAEATVTGEGYTVRRGIQGPPPRAPLTSWLLSCSAGQISSYVYMFWPKCKKILLLGISLSLAETGNFFSPQKDLKENKEKTNCKLSTRNTESHLSCLCQLLSPEVTTLRRLVELAAILPDANSCPPSRTWSPGHSEEAELWSGTQCDFRHICVCCVVCACVFVHGVIHMHTNLGTPISESWDQTELKYIFAEWRAFLSFLGSGTFFGTERPTDQDRFEAPPEEQEWTYMNTSGWKSMASATSTNATPGTRNLPSALRSESLFVIRRWGDWHIECSQPLDEMLSPIHRISLHPVFYQMKNNTRFTQHNTHIQTLTD